MTGNGSCASSSTSATAGWRPTPTSACSTGRWCGPWPSSAAPPGRRSRLTGPVMSWRPSAPFPSRSGAGGPGARPPPRSSATGTGTKSPIRTGPSALSRPTEHSGLTGGGPALPSSGSRPSSAPPTAPTSASRPASTPANRDLGSNVADPAQSGPPASTSRKEHPDGQFSTVALRGRGPVQRLGTAAQPSRPPGHPRPTSPTIRMSCWPGPAPIGRWWRCGSGPRSAGRAAPPRQGGGACGRMSGLPGPGPCPGG
jgi:hypothetical protein